MTTRISWMCVILLWSSVVFGAPSPDELAVYKDAGARLVAMIEAAQGKGESSLLKTSEVMSLVEIVSDEKKILRHDSYAATELGTILDVCDVANRASVSLVLFDMKARLSTATTQQQMQADMVELMARNILTFQDELKELQPFLLRCLAKEVHPLTEFMGALPPADLTEVRRHGVAQMRFGLLQIYSGALQAANDTRYRDDYRIAMLSALAETSTSFASIIQLPVRRQLIDLTTISASNAEEPYKLHLTRIVEAFRNDTCEGLCAIQ